MKLEVLVVPVSDVDRAKIGYRQPFYNNRLVCCCRTSNQFLTNVAQMG
jgi:hypothetical protein